MMRYTSNFSRAELIATTTGLPNKPGPAEEEKLIYLAGYVLQPVRDRWERVAVTSGYRSHAVNERIGGSPGSQHRKGEAADIVPLEADIKDVYWMVKESRIPFGQCILEFRGGKEWIHVSLVRWNHPNNEALVYENGVYRRYNGRL